MKKLIALITLTLVVGCSDTENPTNNNTNNTNKPTMKTMPVGFTNDSVRITSVMPNPPAADGEEKEWFTVTNFSSQPVDLSKAWLMRDIEEIRTQQLYYNFENTIVKAYDSVKVYNKTTQAFMRNTSDTLYLYKYINKDTTLVDMIYWEDAKDNQIFYHK